MGAVASLGPLALFGERHEKTAKDSDEDAVGSEETDSLTLFVNGEEKSLDIDPRTTLLDCLREKMDLTGTKKGCDHGQCGACTVLVDGKRVNACLTLAIMCKGKKVTTVEGLGSPDHLHPLQEAFVKHDGYQCGYCTSGQIMSAMGLLSENSHLDEAAIKQGMSGNICRCGAYKNIVAAIQEAQSKMGAQS